jgi:hypothetical protein
LEQYTRCDAEVDVIKALHRHTDSTLGFVVSAFISTGVGASAASYYDVECLARMCSSEWLTAAAGADRAQRLNVQSAVLHAIRLSHKGTGLDFINGCSF